MGTWVVHGLAYRLWLASLRLAPRSPHWTEAERVHLERRGRRYVVNTRSMKSPCGQERMWRSGGRREQLA